MLCYWYHFSGKRIALETDDYSIGGHFLTLLHEKAIGQWGGPRHTSANLYANATARVIAGTGRMELVARTVGNDADLLALHAQLGDDICGGRLGWHNHAYGLAVTLGCTHCMNSR